MLFSYRRRSLVAQILKAARAQLASHESLLFNLLRPFGFFFALLGALAHQWPTSRLLSPQAEFGPGIRRMEGPLSQDFMVPALPSELGDCVWRNAPASGEDTAPVRLILDKFESSATLSA